MVRVFVILSLVLATPVAAQSMFSQPKWAMIIPNGKFGTSYLVDRNSIKQVGNIFKLTLLVNFQKPLLDEALSYLMNLEMNCANLSTRTISMSTYAENNAKGKKLDGGPLYNPKFERVNQAGDVDFYNFVAKLCGP